MSDRKPEIDSSAGRGDFLLRHLLEAVYWFDDSLQMHQQAAGWPSVSRTKSLILVTVANGISRPIQIAERLGITRQAVHLALKELAEQGLISIDPDPNDNRASVVSFESDSKGSAMRDNAVASLARIESVLSERLGAELYQQLFQAMSADWQAPVKPDTYDR